MTATERTVELSRAAGSNASASSALTGSERQRGCTGELLRRDHQRLEAVYASLLRAYQSDDWREVRAQWDVFETALRSHMENEEKHVLPAFRAASSVEADRIVGEHDQLRLHLASFGVRVDLHAIALHDVETLIERVRAHAGREEQLFYPWLDAETAVSEGRSPAE